MSVGHTSQQKISEIISVFLTLMNINYSLKCLEYYIPRATSRHAAFRTLTAYRPHNARSPAWPNASQHQEADLFIFATIICLPFEESSFSFETDEQSCHAFLRYYHFECFDECFGRF
jgi:hypothetical protein